MLFYYLFYMATAPQVQLGKLHRTPMSSLVAPLHPLAINHIALTGLSHLRYYLVSVNLNYFYNMGFLLGVSIFIQTVTGILLPWLWLVPQLGHVL